MSGPFAVGWSEVESWMVDDFMPEFERVPYNSLAVAEKHARDCSKITKEWLFFVFDEDERRPDLVSYWWLGMQVDLTAAAQRGE